MLRFKTYLIRIDHGMNIVPLLNFHDTKDIMDPEVLQYIHGQRRWQGGQQHAVLRKRLEDMFRQRLRGIPF